MDGLNLYLIEPFEGVKMTGYDRMTRAVVAAALVQEARKVAAKGAGNEGAGVWLDGLKTKVRKISDTSIYKTARIVCADHVNG